MAKSPFYGGGPVDGKTIDVPDHLREYLIPEPLEFPVAFDHQGESLIEHPMRLYRYVLDRAGRFRYVGETTI